MLFTTISWLLTLYFKAIQFAISTHNDFIENKTSNQELIQQNNFSHGTGTTTNYFGNDLDLDLDGNGVLDKIFIITQKNGGSGTFYYVTGLLNGNKQLNNIFLGDRIAPQTINLEADNIIDVNYADRKIDESFVTPPSIGKTLRIRFNKDTELLQDIK